VALRSFTAPDGRSWDVWDVLPEQASAGAYPVRRVRDRRSPDPVLLYKGPERRVTERRRSTPRPSTCLPGLEGGWLVFSSAGVKRRLAPPPSGWEVCPVAALVRLLELAR